jgi:hypothetical protein
MTRKIPKPIADAAADVATSVVEAALVESRRREAEALHWHLFHAQKARTLPRWRVLARAWHRNRARHYRSHLAALEQQRSA